MIFLFNKAKIASYLVALSTVVILFCVAYNFNVDDMTIQAGASLNNNKNSIVSTNKNEIENNIIKGNKL